jgi:serine/threonine protein kinase
MQLGAYEVEGELGRGGMGVVLRGRAPDGTPVAIKVLLTQEKESALARFDRERRVLTELGRESGFVPVLDVGQSPRGPFIVMPFLTGGTLRQRLARGPLSVEDVVELGRTLARALGRAHAKGIVHRDLKPENVLFTAEGRPLVADLGLAKHTSDAPGLKQSISLTKSGDMAGTLGYMAPEQMNNARAAGPPADVFALGVVLYECLAGFPPFNADTGIGVVGRVSTGEFEPVRRARPDAPRWLAEVVATALSPDPAKRPRDGSELALLLAEGAARSRSKTPAVVAAALVGIVVLGGAALLFALEKAPPPLPEPSPSPKPTPSPVRPRPSPTPSPEPMPLTPIPDAYHAVERTKMSRLVAVWGVPDQLPGAGSVSFVPDGTRAAVGHGTGEMRIWDVRENSLVTTRKISSTRFGINKLRFSRDGRLVLAVFYGGLSVLWDVARLDQPAELHGHTHNAIACAFSADGQFALTGGDDGLILAWETWRSLSGERTRPRVVEPQKSWVRELAITQAGDRIAAALNTNVIKLYSFPELTELAMLEGQGGSVASVAYSPDGTRLVSGSDGSVVFWDAATGRILVRTPSDEGTYMRVVVYSPDGKLAAATTDKFVHLLDSATGAELDRLDLAPAKDSPLDMAFLPDGQSFAVTTRRGLVLRYAWTVGR